MVPPDCAVGASLRLAAGALIAERNGNAAIAEEGFEKVFKAGIPLPALLRESGRFFKRSHRFERAYHCYAILQTLAPGAFDEFMDGLSPDLCQYSPYIVRRLLDDDRPHFYTLRPFKEALVRQYGTGGAALILAQVIGKGNDWSIGRMPLRSLRDFARVYGLHYEELSKRKQVVLPPANLFGGSELSMGAQATPRTFFLSVLADVVVASTSNILLAGGCALLDFQDDELQRIPLNLNVDPTILAADGSSVTIFKSYASAPPRWLEQAFSLVGVHSGVFGHWMIEFLPRLWAYLQRPGFDSVPILIDKQMPPQHREALELFVGPQHPIIVLEPRENVRVERLWCCSMPIYMSVGQKPGANYVGDMWAVDPDGFLALLDKVRPNLDAVARLPEPKRLYLKRKPFQKRKLVNGEEVERWFVDRGFDAFDFADLSFLEQIKLIRSAELVVGPDSSAFYMIMFARPGTKVGLLTHQYLDDFEWYPQLCRGLLQQHLVFKGEITRADPQYRHFSDYMIDVNKLPAFLDELACTP